MRISITIIEDQKAESSALKEKILSWSRKTNSDVVFSIYASGNEFYRQYSPASDPTDIYFLDIQLGDMLGLDIAKNLRSHGYQGVIIFLTVFREYVFHGYEVHAMNYLLKPVKEESLYLCLDEVARNLEGRYYIFRNKQEIVQIPFHDILVFSSSFHYVDIMTTGETYCQYSSLNTIIEHLPREFIQIHRSYIVNMEHIGKLSKAKIILSNKMSVPIGRTYITKLTEEFSKYSTRFDA